MVVAGGGDNGGGGGICCMKWWQHNRSHHHNGNGSGNSNSGRVTAAGFVFCLGCFVIQGLIAVLYGWLVLTPPFGSNERKGVPWLGCQEDNEGSWAIGVFYGQSPFSLKPIETAGLWRNESAAWPVANPVITCASASDSGFPSNFAADPFLYVRVIIGIGYTLDYMKVLALSLHPSRWLSIAGNRNGRIDCRKSSSNIILGFTVLIWNEGDTLYMFYETKNSFTMQGDIGVAKSIDKGVTWQQLGIALDEEWHLSYPYVFDYLGQVYMMPESSQIGELRLYRVTNFPLGWELDRVIMKKPLLDPVIFYHDREYWLFGSEHSYFGTRNGQLEIWYSSSPLGPWKPHKKNPVYNTNRSFGARNGGRPFRYNGNLYRIGQDCGETYGRRVRMFKVEVLSRVDYKEVEVPFLFEESGKGRNAWNGARYHHLDVQQLRSGEWVGVMDGDRVPSGELVRRFLLGCGSVTAVAGLILLLGVILGVVKSIVPLNWCADYSGKRSDTLIAWEKANVFSSRIRRVFSRLNRVPSFVRSWIKPNTCTGKLVLALIFALGVVLSCTGFTFIYGGNGAEEPYSWKGQFSQFTLLTMTYDARLWNLKMFVNHYSRCASVKEIVVVWNKGIPPKLSDLNSAVPIRIRVEDRNSLNNRFKIDPLIKTHAVLELDDDIMMTCDDVERGFMLWRQHPERIVGFYPRYVDGSRLEYSGEKYARKNKGYNLILTGAAFMDNQVAFERYWSEQAKPGREVVDAYFNCEDVLLNFLYANASSSKTIEYVRPAWAIDTSKFSSAAISRDTNAHYKIRSKCLRKFTNMYGSMSGRRWEFNSRKDHWDV